MKTEELKNLLKKAKMLQDLGFKVLEEEAKHKGQSLEDLLVEKDLISARELGLLIAKKFGVPFVDLKTETISKKILEIIPEIVARNQEVITFSRGKEGLKVAMARPDILEMREWLAKKTGEKIIPFYAYPGQIRDTLKYYKKELKVAFEEIIKSQIKKAKGKAPESPPIIKLVDTLLEYGYTNRASDIHIEPEETETEVRFRIDGVLHPVLTFDKDIHDLVVTRIKILSSLRTDEHFIPQDGKFRAKYDTEKFGIRVSIIPITHGEKVVMRLLSERARQFNLSNLGLLENDLKIVEANIKKPWGMILATGPTGCGKTTTLYTILKLLNKPGVNITTIEDPIEYDMAGVNQIQVNPKAGLTFAKGLRSIVRQDPDIIMVGEIRDRETAGIAVNSAMTGHLVLSTLHTNNAATSLPRLIDMGIEPFLVASSVNIIIAQRLVRCICPKCKENYSIKTSELGELEEIITKKFPPKADQPRAEKVKKEIKLFRGKGCKLCSNTGYMGRIGIFEVLQLEKNIQDLITGRADASDIQAQAQKNGMTTMLEDGISKMLEGATTLEEILRVIRE